MLNDTMVIWGGEFGRTSCSQGKLTVDDYGRDHHPRCFFFQGRRFRLTDVRGKVVKAITA